MNRPINTLLMMRQGSFIRPDSFFRDTISKDHEKYQPEANRYHIYVSSACPWAHRTLIMRKLKGLEDVISYSCTHPVWRETRPGEDDHTGWTFKPKNNEETFTAPSGGNDFTTNLFDFDGKELIDHLHPNIQYIRDIYEASTVKDLKKHYTVPILWDKKNNCIVNNESSEIIRILNSEFNDFCKEECQGLDFYPEELRNEIDDINSIVYPFINDGVYKTGFSRSQEAYDSAVNALFNGLDSIEEILSKKRYLCGNRLTEADIRLYVTLIRFDEVYYVYFRCCKKRISDYPNIQNYLRELYQIPAFHETTNLNQIRMHYYGSHPRLNTLSIIPAICGVVDDLKKPHDRERLPGIIQSFQRPSDKIDCYNQHDTTHYSTIFYQEKKDENNNNDNEIKEEEKKDENNENDNQNDDQNENVNNKNKEENNK